MNKRINSRSDAYGTDKTLFAKEILQAVRRACGEDFIIGIRLGVFEPALSDGLEHAKALAPYTDFLNISYGGDCDPEKPEDFPLSAAVYGAKRVKEMLPDMPVFAVDHINSRADVLQVMACGIDVADIARASLTDPAFAAHVLADEPAGKCFHCAKCRWQPDGMMKPEMKCPGYEAFHKA